MTCANYPKISTFTRNGLTVEVYHSKHGFPYTKSGGVFYAEYIGSDDRYKNICHCATYFQVLRAVILFFNNIR